ncbi:MAG: bifunctional YncE family protein/alkaline phosphatase family protein [Chthoniobacter sp.]|nr:bifunctional YncE family protein/alkaline phosphatase family protein [Chthoniobacter sp.]
MRFPIVPALLFMAALPFSSHAADLPGQRPDGSVLLPNQWTLRPVGRQVPLGDFPVNLALHPGGKYGAVLHCGYGPHEIVVVDLASGAVACRAKVDEAFYGLTFSKDGSQLLCSGASGENIHIFHFNAGQLDKPSTHSLRDVKQRGIPCGIAATGDGLTLYVANLWGQSVSRVNLTADSAPGVDLSLLPDGAAPPKAPVLPSSTDDPSITKRANQLLETTDPKSPFPYACLLDEKRGRLYVSLWGQASVAVVDTKTFTVSARWSTEDHPNEMILSKDGKRLFVANANRNTVSVLDTGDGRLIETLLAELTPNAPPGNTPNSLALSPDGDRLFVANANINTVSVFDVSTPGKSRSLGFIPVGWYPTSVRLSRDGASLYVVNAKGESSYPNPEGPMNGKPVNKTVDQYIGSLLKGTLSIIPLPPAGKMEAQMHEWSAQAYRCLPTIQRKIDPANLGDGKAPPPSTTVVDDASKTAPRNPIPVKLGDASPIKYVFYIIKENRTYDQVLGDLKPGNGDPSICLFGERVTPNHHAIAREFVTLDNLYVDAEVSASGHEWSMGAIANDFVEKTWHLSYGHGKSGKWPYPAEGGFPIATPGGGYLWDRAKEAGVSYRSYGEWVANGKGLGAPCTAKAKSLEGHIDPYFRSFDTGYPDQKRADRFIDELHRFEKEGDMPRLQIVRLPNDHTSGASPGKPTPAAQVADNDLALGRVIEALSHSKFWPQMAIFIIEDDAQNGSDHVDAHRTIAFAISPYIRRGTVDSTMYSTSSMLHTIELILGLRPMSQFDAAAMPMWASFQGKADLTPYAVKPATTDLEQKNTKTAWGAKASQRMNFTKEDAADDLKLNEIIWKSVRGPDSSMPAPRRAAFVFTSKKKADKDDD